MDTGLAIDARGVGFQFGTDFAIRGLDLRVARGEVFGFLGHNGAGKTTTVRLLNGLLPPSSGELKVLGLSPVADGDRVRARTGVLTELPSLDDRLSARETLADFAELYAVPRESVVARIESVLSTFGLKDQADLRIAKFSKGMRQRLALCRALLHEPELVFLDEPTSGLDPVSAHEVHGLVRGLREAGRTVFLCTHNLVEAQRLCDRIAVIDHGKIIASGTPAELARNSGATGSVEVEVDPAQVDAARAALASLGSPVEVQGAVLRVPLVRESVPAAVQALAAAGVRVYRVNPGEATLEDVYLSLYGRGLTP
ncbi:MAG TPA: ABC transporter ATP-binding protein [Myxococcales bacterium]|jgi:ABC-2 type transport system ATP-binding protein